MKGVKYFFDEQGEPSAVLIDLKKNPEIWEDFRDLMIIEERSNEPVEDLSEVKAKIFGNKTKRKARASGVKV